MQIQHYIEHGPDGLTVASFIGGVFLSIVSLLSIINVLSIPFHPLSYLLNFFILFMGIVTIIIEASPDMLKGGRGERYQTAM